MTRSEFPGLPSARPIARRCLVRGRVQGVYYRASARERARAGGIRGYARNLPDGSVEVMACGEERAVRAFIEWLWLGPSAAKVAEVSVQELQLAEHELPLDFSTA
ncbi:MAG TPA: acylphosphatase [Steroidobacteraceae bacterium]|nr:acylphosphatase [Steroidobacteraceae bacterium]